MQHLNRQPPTPLPNIYRSLPPQPSPNVAPPPVPEFLVIGLFALRLTKHLIEGLERYTERDADLMWLADFLAPYPTEYALAKVSGRRRDEYLDVYEGIFSRMKKQPRFPIRFMQLNPDRSMQRHEASDQRNEVMTDAQRLAIIDFCDAASEWGSTVPIPAREAERMIELADQRRIADLEETIYAQRNERGNEAAASSHRHDQRWVPDERVYMQGNEYLSQRR
ncbi:hypothetical protein ACN47E_002566 [Coniothyrium glycines]